MTRGGEMLPKLFSMEFDFMSVQLVLNTNFEESCFPYIVENCHFRFPNFFDGKHK
jgi:hypothetical protein